MAVTVKAYLKRVGQPQTEIRRFAIEEELLSKYHAFAGKVTTVFPGLHLKTFTMAWKDSDQDLILFSSDEELVEAVNSVNDGVFRVYIEEKGDTEKPAEPFGGQRARVHRGVTCDGCDGRVVGVRYKCEVCPNYDLCEACKSTGLHSEHSMSSIDRPRHWNHFGFGPHGMFPGFFEGSPPMMPPMMNIPPPIGGEAPPPPYMDWESQRLQRRAWKRWMKEAFREAKQCRKAEKRCKRAAKKQEKREKRKMETGEAGEEKCVDMSSTSSSSSSDECETGAEAGATGGQAAGDVYLKSVGQSVAAMLDPLGIDVEVHVDQRDSHKKRHCRRGMWGGMGPGMCGPGGMGPGGMGPGGMGPGGMGPGGMGPGGMGPGGPGGMGPGMCGPGGMGPGGMGPGGMGPGGMGPGGMGPGGMGQGMWGGSWRGHGWGGRGGFGHGFRRGGACGMGGMGGGCPWKRGWWGAGAATTTAAETVPQASQGSSEPTAAAGSAAQPIVINAETGEKKPAVSGSPQESSGWMIIEGGNGEVEGATKGVASLNVSGEASTASVAATSLATAISTNETVTAAVEKMKSMGFTDEGGWLTALLTAHNGDMNAALEVISANKNK